METDNATGRLLRHLPRLRLHGASPFANDVEAIIADLDRLTRERDALMVDKARLDWIENTGAKVFWMHGPDKRETWLVETVTDSNSRPTLREAIDLAMAMSRETGKDGTTASAT